MIRKAWCERLQRAQDNVTRAAHGAARRSNPLSIWRANAMERRHVRLRVEDTPDISAAWCGHDLGRMTLDIRGGEIRSVKLELGSGRLPCATADRARGRDGTVVLTYRITAANERVHARRRSANASGWLSSHRLKPGPDAVHRRGSAPEQHGGFEILAHSADKLIRRVSAACDPDGDMWTRERQRQPGLAADGRVGDHVAGSRSPLPGSVCSDHLDTRRSMRIPLESRFSRAESGPPVRRRGRPPPNGRRPRVRTGLLRAK